MDLGEAFKSIFHKNYQEHFIPVSLIVIRAFYGISVIHLLSR